MNAFRKFCLTLGITLMVNAIMPGVFIAPKPASAFRLFGGFAPVRYGDSTLTFTLFGNKECTPDSYIGQFEPAWEGNGFKGMWCPQNVFIQLKYYQQNVDAKNPGRPMRMMVEDTTRVLTQEEMRKHVPGGSRDIAWDPNGMALSYVVQACNPGTMGFWGYTGAILDNETIKNKMIIVSIAPGSVDEWIDNPYGGTVSTGSPSGPVVAGGTIGLNPMANTTTTAASTSTTTGTTPSNDAPATTNKVPVGNLKIERALFADAHPDNSVLRVKMLDADGKPFTGVGVVKVTAVGSKAGTKVFNIGAGKVAGGTPNNDPGVITVTSGKYKTIRVEASGFSWYEVIDGLVTLHAEGSK